MTTDKHVRVCTGCGEKNEFVMQCVECGEWRCMECHTLGGWCANRSTPAMTGSTDRGAFCARNRPEAKRGVKCRCTIVGHVCEGAVRGIRGTLHGEPFGEHLYYCARFLASLPGSAVNGWCEVPDLTWRMAVALVKGQAGEPRVVLKVPAGLPPGKYEAEYEEPVPPVPAFGSCTECSATATHRCIRCGEWRCAAHRDRTGWCIQTPGETGAGLRCAKYRHEDPWACVGCGNNLKRDPDGRHWDNPIDGRGYCNACWKKREAAPEIRVRAFDRPLTSADRAKLWQDFDANIDAPSTPIMQNVPRTPAEMLAALGNPPGWTEANVLGIHTFGRESAPTPRITIYCEHAPPRYLVESTPVLLDGNELGASTLGTIAGRVSSHLCWSWSLGSAWDRHATWVAALALPGSTTAPEVMMQSALHRIDRDVPPPGGADAFGGVVVADYEVGLLFNSGRAGLRCRLCGGWIRRAVRL